MSRSIILSLISMIAGSAAAEAPRLSRLSLEPEYSGKVFSGYTQDLTGKYWDNGRFYASSEFNLTGTVGVSMNLGEHPYELIVNFDKGYSSQAFNAAPYFGFGVRTVRELSTDSYVILEIQNLLSLSGDIRERPCADALGKEFHCGTLVPWSDYKSFTLAPNVFRPYFSIQFFISF